MTAFRFHCKRCGNCCTRPEGRVRVDPADVPRMAALLELSPAGLASRYLTPGPEAWLLVRLAPDGACPFFEREEGLGACRVYEARPEHCRTFPFWPEVLEDERVLREVQRFCPGIEV
ncbi:MAG TPA: YkgJ family cysteine cluster protein [Planctomycetota bacterium]|nr:YkgJ family cysteine cluster protein [Planctomycetota bacterium]